MRAAIYNPYLDTLGGGERYSMAVARTLAFLDYIVDVEWKNENIKTKLEERFGMDFSRINFVRDIKRGNGYDVCFWVSDGSIPTLFARKNLLHFQIPFHQVKGNTLLNKMKLFRINKIICNSQFTKSFIDKEYGVSSIVIYPPVDLAKIKPKRKENKILFVGRFSQLTQAKNQDVLIRAFKKFYDQGYKNWELILAGGIEVGVGNYLDRLKKMAEGYPVKFITNPPFKDVLTLFGEAKIFWSATGYGANAEKEPRKMEHFGISVVEAMAAGCVPIVFNAGGHREIVSNGKNGFLWTKLPDLVKITKELILDNKYLRSISKEAVLRSNKFSYGSFEKHVKENLQ